MSEEWERRRRCRGGVRSGISERGFSEPCLGGGEGQETALVTLLERLELEFDGGLKEVWPQRLELMVRNILYDA